MDITKRDVFSLEMFSQAFTATTFSCCLFVSLPSVLYLVTEKHALLG